MTKSQIITFTLPNGQDCELNWVTSPIARNIRLSLTKKGLRLATPRYVRRGVIESFLQQQAAWIQSQLERHGSLPPNSMFYLGKLHRLQLYNTPAAPSDRVFADTASILHIYPVTFTVESATQQLERWLKTKASEHATPLLIEYAQKMVVAVPTLRFRDTASRWGSCTNHGAITLNWRLAHVPLLVMRYVVIHELAHRTHLNHSANFWQLVEQHDPDFRVRRGWLKRHGHLCRTPVIELTT